MGHGEANYPSSRDGGEGRRELGKEEGGHRGTALERIKMGRRGGAVSAHSAPGDGRERCDGGR